MLPVVIHHEAVPDMNFIFTSEKVGVIFLNSLKLLMIFINGLQHLINLIYHSLYILGFFFSLFSF